MWTKICGVLMVSTDLNDRPALSGGEGPEDVVSQCLIELLRKPAGHTTHWEGLAMRIAHDRAVDAVRRATKGRRSSSDRDIDDRSDASDEINVVPFDQQLLEAQLAELTTKGWLESGSDPEKSDRGCSA